MNTHSTMTPEELAGLDPAVRGQGAERPATVRLDGGDGISGPRSVSISCGREVADRYATWLRKVAERNRWPGTVTVLR